jgi:hypothetical protein
MEDGVCYPGEFGGACASLSSHPTSVPSFKPTDSPSGEPSRVPSALPSTVVESVGMQSGESDEKSLLSDKHMLVSVSVLVVVIVSCLVMVGGFYFFGVLKKMSNKDAKSALMIKELGAVKPTKFEEKQASLSICLDIVDSDEEDWLNNASSKPVIRKPTIAGTFIEEDVNMFNSDVFS